MPKKNLKKKTTPFQAALNAISDTTGTSPSQVYFPPRDSESVALTKQLETLVRIIKERRERIARLREDLAREIELIHVDTLNHTELRQKLSDSVAVPSLVV